MLYVGSNSSKKNTTNRKLNIFFAMPRALICKYVVQYITTLYICGFFFHNILKLARTFYKVHCNKMASNEKKLIFCLPCVTCVQKVMINMVLIRTPLSASSYFSYAYTSSFQKYILAFPKLDNNNNNKHQYKHQDRRILHTI